MYGASTSGRGAAGSSGGSLVDDGPVGVDGRRNEFAARGGAAGTSSAAPTAHGGHGDGSIFSTSSGLYQVANSRTGSSYAGSAHGGSQSGRKGERRSDATPKPRVAYYDAAPRRAESAASDELRGSRHSDDFGADGRRSSETRARESGDDHVVDDGTIHELADSKKQSHSAKSDSATSDPKRWVRVDDLMRTSLKAETALGKIAEATSAAAQRESPRKQGGIRRVETATQTDVVGLVAPANPRAQLSFQASLQTELRETQELLIETQMRVKELASDKKRLVGDLEEATRARVGARKGGERAATEKDDDDVPDDAMTPTQEEMDETVHSLLEMITAERDRAGALETHLERLTTELDLEREARTRAQNALAERVSPRATDEDFSAQERKLREATEIIAELRRALLSVMQVREGSVFGGSAREGGSHKGSGSDGGSSRRSAGGRSPRGARKPLPAPADVAVSFTRNGSDHGELSVRPLSSAALARAREDQTLGPKNPENPENPERRSAEGSEGRRAAADVAAAEAEAPSGSAPDAVHVPLFRDLDLHDAVRGARVALRRATNTPGFELAWPLLLIAMLLRAQIGPDAFAWSSLTR